MKKIVLSSLLAVAGLAGSLSAEAVALDPTQLKTGAIELTCNHAANSSAMIVTSGGYSVMAGGVSIANQSLKDILAANSAWLASLGKPAYTNQNIASLGIPCTAAIAELDKYALEAYAINFLYTAYLLGPTSGLSLGILPPAIADYSPKLTSNEKGDVTYHWSFFIRDDETSAI